MRPALVHLAGQSCGERKAALAEGLSYIQVVRHDRLQAAGLNGLINLVDRAAVRNLKLLIALVLTRVAADADIHASGNLGRGDADNVVTEACALTC